MNSKHISLHEFTTVHNLQTEDVLENKTCISITDICQNSIVLSPNWGGTLSLKFYDIDLKSHPQCVKKEQAIEVINFMLLVFKSGYDELIIHCHAGISRSAAFHNFFQYYIVKNQNIIDNPPKFIGNSLVYSLLVETYKELFEQDI